MNINEKVQKWLKIGKSTVSFTREKPKNILQHALYLERILEHTLTEIISYGLTTIPV